MRIIFLQRQPNDDLHLIEIGWGKYWESRTKAGKIQRHYDRCVYLSWMNKLAGRGSYTHENEFGWQIKIRRLLIDRKYPYRTIGDGGDV